MPYLTLDDFDVKAAYAFNRGDYRMIAEESAEVQSNHASKSPKGKLGLNFWQRQETSFSHQFARALAHARKEGYDQVQGPKRDIGASTHKEFMQLLNHRFGNCARAWRQALDKD